MLGYGTNMGALLKPNEVGLIGKGAIAKKLKLRT